MLENFMDILTKGVKSLKDPLKAIAVCMEYGRGFYYKGLYKILCKRVVIGKNFRVEGRLSIKGPGTVLIGDNVRCGMRVTPWTCDKDAVIVIGSNVFLNGTRFACQSRIVIGDYCLLADCRIMDTDFHGVNPEAREVFEAKSIVIGNNVWITIGCVILKGVSIGYGSTITPLSVVTKNVPHCCLFGGNPAKFVKWLHERSHLEHTDLLSVGDLSISTGLGG